MNLSSFPEELANLLSVQTFLYREARLLDEGKLEEWLNLFTEDATYVLPIKDGPPPEPAIIRDSRSRIEERVFRLTRTLALAQSPRSRTQHDLTNIEVLKSDGSEEVTVACNQTVHELRPGNPFQTGLAAPRSLHARCRYVLIPVEGEWKIREKRCELLNREFPIHNLTFIF